MSSEADVLSARPETVPTPTEPASPEPTVAPPAPDTPAGPATPDDGSLLALGIAPDVAARLRSVGISTRDQVASWGTGHIEWVAAYLSPIGPGEIAGWVRAARDDLAPR